MADNGRAPSGQALAVPVEPVSRLDPPGFDPSRCRLNYYDAISRQIIDEQGFVLGLILKLGNGRWVVEIDGVRHGRWSERTPQAAFMRWRALAIAMETQRAETENTGSVAKP